MDNKKIKNALKLFTTFFKIGLFSFGGGYAMIPMIQREVCSTNKWLTEEDILEVVAVSESTPGPIAINTATFVGYRTAGVLGAFCATSGVVLPSFIIILILSVFLDKFQSLKAVQYAFNGIRAGVLALIIKALISMAKKCPKNIISYIVAAGAFILSAFFGANVFIIILCCALVGLAYTFIPLKKRNSK